RERRDRTGPCGPHHDIDVTRFVLPPWLPRSTDAARSLERRRSASGWDAGAGVDQAPAGNSAEEAADEGHRLAVVRPAWEDGAGVAAPWSPCRLRTQQAAVARR